MSDKPTSLSNRIPAEDAHNVRPWVLPPIGDNGQVLSSAEKEAKDRREALLRGQQETIETIEIEQPSQTTGISADELQAIVDAAEKEGFSKGEEEGFAKGNSDGYEAGKQQGLMEMRAQLVAEQQRFQRLANSLLAPLAEQDQALEQLLLDTLCTLSQSVVQRELLTDSSHILALVRQAVDALPVGSKHIKISLNPDDLSHVEAYAKEQQLDWHFIADKQLDPGGCRVDTEHSRVDFSVAARLQQVLEQFVNGQLAGGASEAQPPEEH